MSKQTKSPGKDFLLASANMSWQLAVVVLVPILGGFWLDGRIGSLPVFTIIGFLVAMAAMAAVVWRQMRLLSPPSEIKKLKRPRQ